MFSETKLALQYPILYRELFEPLTDFESMVTNIGVDQVRETSKELWVDLSKVAETPVDIVSWEKFAGPVQGVILPVYDEPGRHLLNCSRNYVEGKLNVGIWIGDRKHLKLLEQAVDLVAIPYWEPRSVYVLPEDAPNYHFYEFCNLDELRRLRPRSLNTSVPFTAAAVGIDLRLRERRPRALPPFSYGMTLTEAQLELALNNVQAIREALGQ